MGNNQTINNMNTLSINCKWNFVAKEISSSSKCGTQKGEMLFGFQILLSAMEKLQDIKEKRILTSIYQRQKEKYKNL